jgi:hypothetical protein
MLVINKPRAVPMNERRQEAKPSPFAISTCIIQPETDALMVCKIKEKNSTEGGMCLIKLVCKGKGSSDGSSTGPYSETWGAHVGCEMEP